MRTIIQRRSAFRINVLYGSNLLYGLTTKSPNMVKLCPGKVQTNW